MDAPRTTSVAFLGFDSQVEIAAVHPASLMRHFAAAGPDGIRWLMPDRLCGLLVPQTFAGWINPGFTCCAITLENACAIVDGF